MSDGALFKPEKDYSKDADKIIPEAEELAKVGVCGMSDSYPVIANHIVQSNIQAAIDKLLGLEKQARQVCARGTFDIDLSLSLSDDLSRPRIFQQHPEHWFQLSLFARMQVIGACSMSKSCYSRRNMDNSSKRLRRWCRW